MPDDHARPSADSDAETDSGSSSDGGPADHSPGGGPKRVVSETSVDDILASIESEPETDIEEGTTDGEDRTIVDEGTEADDGTDETAAGASDENDESEEPTDEQEDEASPDEDEDGEPEISEDEDGEADRCEDEGDEPETGETDDVSDDVDGDAENGTDTGVAATFDENEIDDETDPDAPPAEGTDRTAPDRDESPAADDRNESQPVDEGDGELAGRIERGAVTGADVRAAEAGEGRDPTPEVDEIDLSLDDIDTSTPSSGGDPAATPGDGDAAGSADEPTEEGASGGERVGLLGRLKRLLSR